MFGVTVVSVKTKKPERQAEQSAPVVQVSQFEIPDLQVEVAVSQYFPDGHFKQVVAEVHDIQSLEQAVQVDPLAKYPLLQVLHPVASPVAHPADRETHLVTVPAVTG